MRRRSEDRGRVPQLRMLKQAASLPRWLHDSSTSPPPTGSCKPLLISRRPALLATRRAAASLPTGQKRALTNSRVLTSPRCSPSTRSSTTNVLCRRCSVKRVAVGQRVHCSPHATCHDKCPSNPVPATQVAPYKLPADL